MNKGWTGGGREGVAGWTGGGREGVAGRPGGEREGTAQVTWSLPSPCKVAELGPGDRHCTDCGVTLQFLYIYNWFPAASQTIREALGDLT